MSKRTIAVVVVIAVVITSAGGLAWYYLTPAPFSMQVTSRPTIPTIINENIMSLAGQRNVYLVTAADEEGWLQGRGLGEPVSISATTPSGMANVAIQPQTITPGQVAEVTVVPSEASVNETLTIAITGERHGLRRTETVAIEVIMEEDTLGSYATEMRDMFIPWLAANHPELGITNETEWTGTIVNPRILVVMHYIFYSEEWEMYLTWHVTIPPHDWTRIYLRHRYTETRPSQAFEISSVKAQEEPHAIEVADWV